MLASSMRGRALLQHSCNKDEIVRKPVRSWQLLYRFSGEQGNVALGEHLRDSQDYAVTRQCQSDYFRPEAPGQALQSGASDG